jgi:hypothetical protein
MSSTRKRMMFGRSAAWAATRGKKKQAKARSKDVSAAVAAGILPAVEPGFQPGGKVLRLQMARGSIWRPPARSRVCSGWLAGCLPSRLQGFIEIVFRHW